MPTLLYVKVGNFFLLPQRVRAQSPHFNLQGTLSCRTMVVVAVAAGMEVGGATGGVEEEEGAWAFTVEAAWTATLATGDFACPESVSQLASAAWSLCVQYTYILIGIPKRRMED